jgi:hypothetical protein
MVWGLTGRIRSAPLARGAPAARQRSATLQRPSRPQPGASTVAFQPMLSPTFATGQPASPQEAQETEVSSVHPASALARGMPGLTPPVSAANTPAGTTSGVLGCTATDRTTGPSHAHTACRLGRLVTRGKQGRAPACDIHGGEPYRPPRGRTSLPPEHGRHHSCFGQRPQRLVPCVVSPLAGRSAGNGGEMGSRKRPCAQHHARLPAGAVKRDFYCPYHLLVASMGYFQGYLQHEQDVYGNASPLRLASWLAGWLLSGVLRGHDLCGGAGQACAGH